MGIVIALLQIRLTKQLHNQMLAKEKGYLVLKKENEGDIFYNLKSPFRFKLFGNGDVILMSEQVMIDGNIVVSFGACEQFIPREGRTHGIKLELNENKLKLNRLNIDFEFKLKNLAGYKYAETMQLEFRRVEQNEYWELTRENILFEG